MSQASNNSTFNNCRRSLRIQAAKIRDVDKAWEEYLAAEKEEELKDEMEKLILATQKAQAEKNKKAGMDKPAVFKKEKPKKEKPKKEKPKKEQHPHAGNDDFNTPAAGWDLAKRYLIKDDETKVWQPFYNDGEITSNFKNSIHIKKDFFTYEPDEWDCVIDNPPYTTKKDIIENLLKKGKPFALLIPSDTMKRVWFYKLKPSSLDLTIIIPKSCYVFKGTDKDIKVETAWFCFGFKLGRQLIYEGEDLMAAAEA